MDTAPADEPRSLRKRRTMLAAAADAFLAHGYAGTSMDEIATLAAVSKQTIYSHFTDKERLFGEVALTIVGEIGESVHERLPGLAEADDPDAGLRDLARRLLDDAMQPRRLALRRLVIAEAGRFPALGRAFDERGPGRTVGALTLAFERLTARGRLRGDDPRLAAQHFIALVVSIPLDRAMLHGSEPPDRAELERHADAGVTAFLAAYGAR